MPQLAAGGSLMHAATPPRPSVARRLRLATELALLFLLAPLLIAWIVHGLRVPLFLVLLPALAALFLYLGQDRSFSLRTEMTRGFTLSEFVSMLAIFLVVAAALIAWVRHSMAGEFLAFPIYQPRLWLAVMVLYPLLSALPQELAYRTFFFHRYGPAFGRWMWPAIAINGMCFGFAHVIFGTAIAVVLSGALGVLLAWRYQRTRSLWAVWFEHVLYGELVFTIGLGRYFFLGVSLT